MPPVQGGQTASVPEDDEEEEDWSEERKAAGKRIFVLTPQGQTLQVWKSPGGGEIFRAALFGRKLIVKFKTMPGAASRLLALKGV